VAALWAWVALRYYNKQQEIALAQLRMIAEVNHHVRNALTAMLYSVELTQDKALIEMTRSSIDRIDWTLREILPGKKPEEDDTPDNATRSRKAS
jgi:signal transduction histidine kinase